MGLKQDKKIVANTAAIYRARIAALEAALRDIVGFTNRAGICADEYMFIIRDKAEEVLRGH